MKKMRRFAAIAAAAAMTACMAMPMTSVWAATQETGGLSISFQTQHESDKGVHSFEAYQIFSGEMSAGVLVGIKWGDAVVYDSDPSVDGVNYDLSSTILNNLKASKVFGEGEDNKFYSCKTAEDVANILGSTTVVEENEVPVFEYDKDMAREVAAIIGDAIAAQNQYTSNKVQKSGTYNTDNRKIENLPAGYYLIQDQNTSPADMEDVNAGAKTRYILSLTTENATVEIKSSAPEVMKKVYEETNLPTDAAAIGILTEADKNWNDVADYDISDMVPFKLYGTMPSTLNDYEHYYYKFIDTLDSRFTVEDSANWVIKVLTEEDSVKTEYVVAGGETNIFNVHKDTNGDGLTVTIEDVKNMKGQKLNADGEATGEVITIPVNETSVITVEYKAELNKDAVIGLNGQENKVKLEYSNNPNAYYVPSYDKSTTDDEIDKNDTEESDKTKWDEDDTTPETPDKKDDTSTDDKDESEDNTGDTPEDKVIVFTYELDIDKTNAEIAELDENATEEEIKAAQDAFGAAKLAGAKFVLYKKVIENSGESIYAVQVDDGNRVTGWVKGAFNEETGEFETAQGVTGEASVLSSGTDGDSKTYQTIKVIGLDEGTYYLKETKEPSGYNKLTTDVKLVVEAATANRQDWTEVDDYKLPEHALTGLTLTVDGEKSSALAAGEELGRNGTAATGVNKGLVWTQVVNKEGSSLPSTGGIGTTLFYVIGGTLAAGAGVGLIAKKRMKNEE